MCTRSVTAYDTIITRFTNKFNELHSQLKQVRALIRQAHRSIQTDVHDYEQAMTTLDTDVQIAVSESALLRTAGDQDIQLSIRRFLETVHRHRLTESATLSALTQHAASQANAFDRFTADHSKHIPINRLMSVEHFLTDPCTDDFDYTATIAMMNKVKANQTQQLQWTNDECAMEIQHDTQHKIALGASTATVMHMFHSEQQSLHDQLIKRHHTERKEEEVLKQQPRLADVHAEELMQCQKLTQVAVQLFC